jgi:hypothetical protein
MDGDLVEGSARRYALMRPHLDERARRLLLGAEAEGLGWGGVSALAAATGVERNTIARGAKEVRGEPSGRVRAVGAGRKALASVDPTFEADLRALVEPATAGDPMRPLLWTTKSTRRLAAALAGMGHKASASTVGRTLAGWGYSLQSNKKALEKSDHPDRDAQFAHVNDQTAEHLAAGQPVISVDTKKKELIGQFKNAGREWAPKASPTLVNGHDFPDPALGKAIPYGVYDIAANDGWVSVGTDHDTSAFAVATIAAWWDEIGSGRYPGADRLLICADSGGPDGSRAGAWKVELARLAEATGLAITVAHLPPGTSKWNKIEHKMFSFTAMNWRARPLTSHETVVNLIAATTTTTGLTITARLDTSPYPTGSPYTAQDIEALPMRRHQFHGDWNYTITPPDTPEPSSPN